MKNYIIQRTFGRHAHGRRRGPEEDWGPYMRFFGPVGVGLGRRQRRGDVKFLVLQMLADKPMHGYEIIRSFEERRGFRISAGSVYPTLQLLEDGGFVTSETVEGKRVYTIADAGRELLATRASGPDGAEAEGDDEADARHRLKQAAFKLGAAVMSARGADDATLETVRTILNDARKRVYEVLAADEA